MAHDGHAGKAGRMRVGARTTADGVTEQLFGLTVDGEAVPGVLWTPAHAAGPRPLVLMAHGGSQHKKVESLVERAHHYVTGLGYAVAALDAPGHGERVSPAENERRAEAIRALIARRERVSPETTRELEAVAARAVPEWRTALDALRRRPEIGDGPVGWWGVSMGTVIGVALVAVEPRITAAVFGLAGLPAEGERHAAAAAAIRVPVEFVLQSDDEIVSRESGLALYDAFGSRQKTLHLNPGGHLGVPSFERASWERFFQRHLGRPGGPQ